MFRKKGSKRPKAKKRILKDGGAKQFYRNFPRISRGLDKCFSDRKFYLKNEVK